MDIFGTIIQFILSFMIAGTFVASIGILIVAILIHNIVKSVLKPFLCWLFK